MARRLIFSVVAGAQLHILFAALALAALAFSTLTLPLLGVGRYRRPGPPVALTAFGGAAATPATIFLGSFSHVPSPHSEISGWSGGLMDVGFAKDTVWGMGDLDHWDEQRRRMRERVEPLVGFVGVGGRLKVVNDEGGLTIQPAISTVVALLLAAVVMVPYAIWAFFQTFESTIGLVGVVVVGGMLEILLVRYLVRMQRLRIVCQDLVIERVFGGKVTAQFQAADFDSMYVGNTWYRSEGIETRNNVVWVKRIEGDDIPLVASDKDVDEVVAVIGTRLGLPASLSNYRSDPEPT